MKGLGKLIVLPVNKATQTQTHKQMKTEIKLTEENFTRIESDMYGNPRYYLPIFMAPEAIARKFGAVKYRGKRYGAGWVFQTYSVSNVCDKLNANA
jgi:hypothetical protein